MKWQLHWVGVVALCLVTKVACLESSTQIKTLLKLKQFPGAELIGTVPVAVNTVQGQPPPDLGNVVMPKWAVNTINANPSIPSPTPSPFDTNYSLDVRVPDGLSTYASNLYRLDELRKRLFQVQRIIKQYELQREAEAQQVDQAFDDMQTKYEMYVNMYDSAKRRGITRNSTNILISSAKAVSQSQHDHFDQTNQWMMKTYANANIMVTLYKNQAKLEQAIGLLESEIAKMTQ